MRLFLCEKPSQGKDIARILGATQRGEGCYRNAEVTVTWCIGHLVEAAPPESYGEQYKRWSLEQLPIVPEQWLVGVKPKTAAQFKIIKKLLAQATELVIATDADREGEMIAREVIELCDYRGPARRLWLSALNDASIRKALGQMKPAHETLLLYHCALARSRADWLIGMNLSRLFTVLGRQAGYNGVLSVGRVQTPTLRLVVDRDRSIEHFQPVPYWQVEVTLAAGNQPFIALWQAPANTTDDAGRCIQQAVAQHAQAQVSSGGQASVISVKTERVREAPPLPFSLGVLQEVCSRRFGMDVQDTLAVAQALYEKHKATTYPRSDTGYLPESMLDEVPVVLQAILKTDPSVRPLMEKLNSQQRSRAWDDGKVTAHHGIIPTQEPANLAAMSDTERKVYDLIRAHYLAQFLPHHEFDQTVAHFECAGHPLQANGKQIVASGWQQALASDATDKTASGQNDTAPGARSQTLPPLSEGDLCAVRNAELKTLQTQPPKPYTQGDLVAAMKGVARFVSDPRLKATLRDTTGIGTEATRASIISGLLTRGYLVQKGRGIHSTDAARALIDAVPAAITDPGTTAVWEQALEMIGSGQLSVHDFITKQSAWVTQLVQHYRGTRLNIKASAPPTAAGGNARRRTPGKRSTATKPRSSSR